MDFCRIRELCDIFKNTGVLHCNPLQPVVEGFPNESVGLDISGPLPVTR